MHGVNNSYRPDARVISRMIVCGCQTARSRKSTQSPAAASVEPDRRLGIMKFGTLVFPSGAADLAKNARKAEELGFESLWVVDHILVPLNYASQYPYAASGRLTMPDDAPFHDPMLALTYVAAITTRIRLGTGIYLVPMRNPFATAKAVATLDTLSGGRFIFGVGIGWLKEEFEALGMNFEDRAARTAEYLKLMTELWSKSDPVFKGRTVKAEGFKFMPKTVQQPHPPFVLGGTTDASLRRAARLGDGWYGIAHNLEQAQELIKRLRECERAEGRAVPLEITISLRTAGALTVDHVRRVAEMGAVRMLVAGALAGRDSIAAMERLHEDVMSKL
jgi:probable F420-dependent oxidoreductase